jgi:hypothetical protein
MWAQVANGMPNLVASSSDDEALGMPNLVASSSDDEAIGVYVSAS